MQFLSLSDHLVGDNPPTSEKLADMLHTSSEPIDILLAMYEKIYDMEQANDLDAARFILYYATGDIKKHPEWVQWMVMYHVVEVLRLRIQSALFYQQPKPRSPIAWS